MAGFAPLGPNYGTAVESIHDVRKGLENGEVDRWLVQDRYTDRSSMRRLQMYETVAVHC